MWGLHRCAGDAIFAFVILSEAKDLLDLALTKKQILRFAQDDNN